MSRFVLASALCFALGSPAFAQEGGSEGNVSPAMNRSELGVDFVFFTRSGDTGSATVFSPALHGLLVLNEDFAASADWGFVYLSGRSDNKFKISNLFLAGHYLVNLETARVRFGLGLALPLATIDDQSLFGGLADAAAYGAALGVRGLRDVWLWGPNNMFIVFPVGAEYVDEPLVLGADVVFSYSIYTGDSPRGENNLFLQFVPRIAHRSGGTTIGVQLAEVARLTGGGTGDRDQLSLEPYFEIDLGGPYVRAAFTVNLDAPAGFSFDSGKVWGLHFGGGSRF